MLEELEKEFRSSDNTFFSRFDRLNVQEMSELRRSLEKVSKRTVVVKHAFAKKIFEKMEFPEVNRFLEGSILVTLGEGEPQWVSKALVEFVKGHENLKLKGAIVSGKIYEANFVRELAKLPPRRELLALLVTRIKSPIANLALTLGSLLQSLVTVLDEVRKKKS